MLILSSTFNQALEQRSYIALEFPDEGIFRIPFFENISISESKKANYNKYSPLGRSSPLYSYFNSDSRSFELAFSINMDHILHTLSTDLESLTFPQRTFSGKLDRDAFFKNFKPSSKVTNAVHGAASFDKEIESLIPELVATVDANRPQLVQRAIIAAALDTFPKSVRIIKAKVIDFIVYWVNLVRCTVINKSTDTTKGPPLVRITHGILYQDVPCICLNYKIEYDENAGMDRNTMLPRKINISLSLVEVRHGDFTKYEMAKPIKRDNIVGWESVITPGGAKTLDPIRIRI